MCDAQAVTSLELHGSRILIGAGLMDSCGADIRAALPHRRLAIISDDTVAPLYAARVVAACAPDPVSIFTIPAGEEHKTRPHWARITDELLDAGFGRDSAILALGGGVVGDLAGFVAATYMRGVPFVQIPTSLLAMIDAAIGGKTGVDTRAGKNLVGAFHHPSLVIVDAGALSTLPLEHVRNGLAEAIKHGVIASREEFDWIAANIGALLKTGGPDAANAEHHVRKNNEIKSSIEARDERRRAEFERRAQLLDHHDRARGRIAERLLDPARRVHRDRHGGRSAHRRALETCGGNARAFD